MMGDTFVSWSACGGDLACVLVSRRAIGRSFLVIQERKQSGDLAKVLLASPASSSFDDSRSQELPKRALIIVSDDEDQ